MTATQTANPLVAMLTELRETAARARPIVDSAARFDTDAPSLWAVKLDLVSLIGHLDALLPKEGPR